MKFINDNFFIITGGPGVGKTTVLNEIEESGYTIIPEVAREIISTQIKINGSGLPWENKELFTDLMLKASLESYKNVLKKNSTSIFFFDRGIPDTLCYSEMIGKGVSIEMEKIVQSYRYNKNVFILPPWLEIYQTDNERKQTWEEAASTYKIMKQTYLNFGYQVIDVPTGPIEDRKNFILNHMGNFS